MGWVTMRKLVHAFCRSVAGNFAVTLAVICIPLMLGVGLAIDFTNVSSTRSELQHVADGAALALAASREQDKDKLRSMAEAYIAASAPARTVQDLQVARLEASDSEIRLGLTGNVPTEFMKLANFATVDVGVQAVAKRALNGTVEVALVLDNTWSMSETGTGGKTKIATLKEAAGSLIDQLYANKDANVRVGLVPYADYVNVGTQYRNEPWLSIPADYQVEPSPKSCKIVTTKSVCTEHAPTYGCTKVIDGVSEPSTCGGACTKSETQIVTPYESCTGGGSPTKYTWYGCVGSRIKKNNRLHDKDGADKYPGFLATSQKCLNPVVPLTGDKGTVKTAVDQMIINIGSYKPNTFIPAGLVWGLNLLSDTAPFDQADAYDPSNRKPRKVAVLMTDGENTLRFSPSDGKHVAFSTNSGTAKGELKQANKDTSDICDYMKENRIEIFTVAFMVKSEDAKALLQGCATDLSHYYDASDSGKLVAAFTNIAQSLSVVRLAE